MKSLLDKAAIVAFIISTLAVAVLLYLYDRRGRKIGELLYEVQKSKLDSKLKAAQEEVRKDGKLHADALAQYHRLLERYSALAQKLGVSTPRSDSRRTQPND
jgi:hypothetical protein